MFKIFLFVLLLLNTLNAYQSEEKLKVLIIGKVAKYISWQEKPKDNFVITVLKNENEDLFSTIYKNKKIKKRPVKINYIDDISQLKDTQILYISKLNTKNLQNIFEQIKDKNIFTVSDIRGFAERGGVMQVYFTSQKVRLRINLDTANKEKLKIKSSLLRITDVIRGKYIDENNI